ncbi:putative deoxyribonuclease TATDN3-like protein [Gongronella butleri]|nr:putative deoxyribonuclease TATDN3-like protein [Gongronella butleri]
MIDVHAHLTPGNFPDIDILLHAAKKAGVEHIVSVSESVADAASVLEVARQSSGMVWASLGLHPVQTLDDGTSRSVTMDDWLAFKPMLVEAIKNKAIVCVGEVGLDFSRQVLEASEDQEKARDEQRKVFVEQIKLAMDANLPVNVHSRSAGHHALKVLNDCGAILVNMHAFDGKASYVKQGISSGFYFSIPPSMVRLAQQASLAKIVPMSHLLLESDAPALAPVKGAVNEPKNLVIAAEGVAAAKDMAVDDVKTLTVANAKRLFVDQKAAKE